MTYIKYILRRRMGLIAMLALLITTAIPVSAHQAIASDPVLQVTNSAEPSIAMTYRWSIAKSANPNNLALYSGQSGFVDYTVMVTKDLPVTTWLVSGAITIHNPAEIRATIASVTDMVSPAIAATVGCAVSFPYDLGPDETLICTYSAVLPDASSRTSTATVTLLNTQVAVLEKQATAHTMAELATDFAATAPVDFGNVIPQKALDSVDVTDAYAGALGSTAASHTWTFRRWFTCDPDSGSRLAAATIVQTGQSAQALVGIVCATPQPARCDRVSVSSTDRSPTAGQTIRVEGFGSAGRGPNAAVSYRFVFGDRQETAWKPIGAWPAVATHVYSRVGAYQLQFQMQLADGRIVGGANTNCAVLIEVRPAAVCGERQPLLIAGVKQAGRRLQVVGLAADNAQVAIQIQGPNDAMFLTNGAASADTFGSWVYTTSTLAQDGAYQIRAIGYGLASENTVSYSLGSGRPPVTVSTFRAGNQGYTGVADTYINAQAPASSYGSSATLSLLSDDAMDPLLRFDLSAIPTNARIVMAKLGLYSPDNLPCTNMVASAYQVIRPWDAATVNWNLASPGINWSAPAANGVAVDRAGLPTYTETIKGPSTWYNWDVTGMVQLWVANPGANAGMIIKAATASSEIAHADNDLDQSSVVLARQPLANGLGGQRDFAASEYPLQQRRPLLYVTYAIP